MQLAMMVLELLILEMLASDTTWAIKSQVFTR